eukprot:TRINITY_DN36168_c0_g1_i1.p1 TRINITY_DN36168_c0_g1~~TRINITY_DN36168_c0_g1_i1.p1  ORF type:complete len:1070 (+),score=192.98 TRINITY_DN36168_c0_g1_i1:43-3252(+)
MGGAAGSKPRKYRSNDPVQIDETLVVKFGPKVEVVQADGVRHAHTTGEVDEGSGHDSAEMRRHTVQDVKAKLLDTGLNKEEVDLALQKVAQNMVQDAAVGTGGNGVRALKQASTSKHSQTAGLVDAAEILSVIEDVRGAQEMSKAARQIGNASTNYTTWMDRCEALLEQQDEAKYLEKKLLAAQVRAYLIHCGDTTEKEQKFMQRRVGALLGASSTTDADVETKTAQEIEYSDTDSEDGDGWFSKMESVKSVRPDERQKRSEGLGMTAIQLFEKLLARKSRMPVSKRYVHKLLDAFSSEWIAKYGVATSCVDQLEVPKGGQMIVVGDTHGQLADVLTIFLRHGTPSSRNRYVFNGDIADRGNNAVDIFCLLFAFFVEDNDSVLILRGNHEDEEMNKLDHNEGGGFHDEVLRKYSGGIFMKFEAIYKLLPLAAVIQNEVFVVHGGLARTAKANLSIPFIKGIDSGTVSCPHGGYGSFALNLHEQVFQDLVWSDPHEKLGWEPSPRGAGIKWGPDLTAAFLKRTGLKWIIRSHQLPEGRRGYSSHHLGLVYTLFSASNYCGTSQNKGAVCLLELNPDGSFAESRLLAKFEEHYAPALEQGKLLEIYNLPDMAARRAALEDAGAARASEDQVRVGERQEEVILARMAGAVVEFRPELWEVFRGEDLTKSGHVSLDTWTEILTAVCGENYPWALGADIWNVCGRMSGARVDYDRFLRRFDVALSREKWVGWKMVLMKDVYEHLYCRDADLKQTLSLFDPENTGYVSMENFLTVLQSQTDGDVLGVHVLSSSQLQSLARGLFPVAADGKAAELQIYDFFERFAVIYRQAKTMTGQDDPLAEWRGTLSQLGRLVIKQDRADATMQPSRTSRASFSRKSRKTLFSPTKPLVNQFMSADDSGDGLLQTEEIVQFLKELDGIEDVMHHGRPLGDSDFADLASKLDLLSGSETQQVNLFSFLEAFMVERPEGADFDNAEEFACEHILSFLYRHRHAVCCGCEAADPHLNGRIRCSAFAEVLRGIDVSLARKRRTLSDLQIEGLADSLGEEDGSFSYFELLQALIARDNEKLGGEPGPMP